MKQSTFLRNIPFFFFFSVLFLLILLDLLVSLQLRLLRSGVSETEQIRKQQGDKKAITNFKS